MVTEIAKQRLKILVHWEQYGMKSALHAFSVSERTLWNWERAFRKGGRKVEALNPKKRTPKRKRTRTWDIRILEEIRRLRELHPNLGAAKILPLLEDFADSVGIPHCPRKATIERLIHDLGGLRTYPQKITGTGRVVRVKRGKVLRKPKDFVAEYPGHCIALDTVEKQRNGKRMYLLTALDVYTRTAFALGTRSHGSKTAAQFFLLIEHLFPYPIHTVLTDNGSEFKKCLDALLCERGVTHYRTYPRTPEMNPHCERFNSTVQAEFVDFHTNLLFDDITAFNTKLAHYLTFYNEKRVHHAFGNKRTPIEVLVHSEYYSSQLPVECNNGWGYTLF
jgi:transposase InsO family protein